MKPFTLQNVPENPLRQPTQIGASCRLGHPADCFPLKATPQGLMSIRKSTTFITLSLIIRHLIKIILQEVAHEKSNTKRWLTQIKRPFTTFSAHDNLDSSSQSGFLKCFSTPLHERLHKIFRHVNELFSWSQFFWMSSSVTQSGESCQQNLVSSFWLRLCRKVFCFFSKKCNDVVSKESLL